MTEFSTWLNETVETLPPPWGYIALLLPLQLAVCFVYQALKHDRAPDILLTGAWMLTKVVLAFAVIAGGLTLLVR